MWSVKGLGLGIGVVSLLGACSASYEDESVGSSEQELVAPTALNEFALLASGVATFKDRSTVSNGHVGVAPGTGDSVTAGFDSKIALGKATLGQRVVLKDRAALGDLFANTVVGTRGTYASLSAYAAPPAPPPIAPFSAGTGNTVINTPTTLPGGAYGNITVNSTLTLSGGTYRINNLTLNNNSVVQAASAVIVRVAGKINGLNNVRLVPTGTQTADTLRIYVAGANDATGGITLGTDSRLTALVVSRASVSFNDRFVGNGAIAARNATFGFDARFSFGVGFECSADAGCDDGNECTTDTCVDAQCLHSAASDGSSCADDGNECTSDECVSGECAHPAAPAGSACSETDVCDGAGACVECTDDSQCADDLECTADSCVNNACAHENLAEGAACDGGEGLTCDGNGVCGECEASDDCADDNECTAESCVDHGCSVEPVAAGLPCDGGTCDGAGACL